MKLSKRVQSVKPSPTLAIDAKAKALQASGLDIVSFGAGEPDFDTPNNIKTAAIDAINSGFTKYCPVGGTPDLKKAIIEKFKKDSGVEYTADEIIVSCGAKHSLYNLFQAILDDGDELLIPAPYWVSYPDMALLAGAVPVAVQTSEKNSFKLVPEDIKKAITPKTKAIVLNSPCNPTGCTYTKAELTAVVKECIANNIFIIADEIYEALVFDNFEFCSVASTIPEAKANAAIINGVSKAYAMTGWRIGYCAAPKEIVAAMTKLQSQSTSNPTSIAMKAATEAIKGDQTSVKTMLAEFQKRRDYITERLNSIKGITCLKPTGAFYVFPNITGLIGKKFDGKVIANDMELAGVLLEKALIAVVPGSSFGAEGYIRLSYASSMENIKKGLDRLEKFVNELA